MVVYADRTIKGYQSKYLNVTKRKGHSRKKLFEGHVGICLKLTKHKSNKLKKFQSW